MQVHAVSCSAAYQSVALLPSHSAQLQRQNGLTLQELCAAKWIYSLLDYDNDGEGVVLPLS